MGIRASDHPALMAAIKRQEAKDNANKPEEQKVMWVARSNMLKIKPIVSRDPVLFKQMVEKIQEMNPGLTLYLFEIEGI